MDAVPSVTHNKSIYPQGAVDGFKYEPHQCVELSPAWGSGKQPWWQVNLGKEYEVGLVKIYYFMESKYGCIFRLLALRWCSFFKCAGKSTHFDFQFNLCHLISS